MKMIAHILWMFFCPLFIFAQQKLEVEFGNVTAADFAQTRYDIDPEAGAVVLFDKGHLDFVGDNKGWFDLRFKRHCRIHILRDNGFDAATVEVPLYHRGTNQERINQIEAITYTLENGKVIKTKLQDEAIFKLKHDKNYDITKFTLPNVKEGVIIEFSYQLRSDFYYVINLWNFQGKYPTLWSELTFDIPQFFGFVSSQKGERGVDYTTSREKTANFSINLADNATQASDWVTLTCKSVEVTWGLKNIAAMKDEPFISTWENYQSSIGFQLSEHKEPLKYKKFTSDWDKFNKELLEDDEFGKQISGNKSVVKDLLLEVGVDTENNIGKAKAIYRYIRDHFQVKSGSEIFFKESLKAIVQNKAGRAHEINMLMVAALREAGLNADPVLISTRDHGFANPYYPLISDYNAVICRLIEEGKIYFLDASEPGLGFGKISTDARNGHGRVIGKEPEGVFISPDSLMEKETILVKMAQSEYGEFTGTMEYKASPTTSHQWRKRYFQNPDKIVDLLSSGIDKENIVTSRVDSMFKPEEPVLVYIKFNQLLSEDSFLYFSPFQFALTRSNEFKSIDRKLPVEFTHLSEELYICTLPVPRGYKIESLPKNQSFAIDEKNSVTFEVRCSEAGGNITVRSKLKINKSVFSFEEYPDLKETIDFVVNRHSEQIVFKKL